MEKVLESTLGIKRESIQPINAPLEANKLVNHLINNAKDNIDEFLAIQKLNSRFQDRVCTGQMDITIHPAILAPGEYDLGCNNRFFIRRETIVIALDFAFPEGLCASESYSIFWRPRFRIAKIAKSCASFADALAYSDLRNLHSNNLHQIIGKIRCADSKTKLLEWSCIHNMLIDGQGLWQNLYNTFVLQYAQDLKSAEPEVPLILWFSTNNQAKLFKAASSCTLFELALAKYAKTCNLGQVDVISSENTSAGKKEVIRDGNKIAQKAIFNPSPETHAGAGATEMVEPQSDSVGVETPDAQEESSQIGKTKKNVKSRKE